MVRYFGKNCTNLNENGIPDWDSCSECVGDPLIDDCDNKITKLEKLATKYDIEMSQIAYMGDDLNDLEVLKIVGLSAMPPQSPIIDIFTPDIITENKGGEGAFRNLADIILKAQNIL